MVELLELGYFYLFGMGLRRGSYNLGQNYVSNGGHHPEGSLKNRTGKSVVNGGKQQSSTYVCPVPVNVKG